MVSAAKDGITTKKQITEPDEVTQGSTEHPPRSTQGKLIAATEVTPYNHSVTSLGSYEKKPKGFRIEVDSEEVSTTITSGLLQDKTEYVLHVANGSPQSVSVEVWQL